MKFQFDEKLNVKKKQKIQDDNVFNFQLLNSLGMGDMFLDLVKEQIKNAKKLIELEPIRNKKVKEYYHYKQYKKELKTFFKDNKIINPYKLFEALNLSYDKVKKEYQGKNVQTSDIYHFLTKQYSKRNKGDYEKNLLLTNNAVHKITHMMRTFRIVYHEVPNMKDPILQRFNLIYLYVALFETLRELYKPIYIKISGVKENLTSEDKKKGVKRYTIRNQINHFKKNNPLLAKYWDYDLRNDASHVLYESRTEYTNKKLEKYCLNLMLEIVAYTFICIDDFTDMLISALKKSKEFDEKRGKK